MQKLSHRPVSAPSGRARSETSPTCRVRRHHAPVAFSRLARATLARQYGAAAKDRMWEKTITETWATPAFEEIRMDAEIGSYACDFAEDED